MGAGPGGAAERLRALHDAHAGGLLAYALRRVDAAEDAADVVAETFLVAWRRIGEVPGGSAARPWLFGVARRVLANRHRATRRHRRLVRRLSGELGTTLEQVVPPPRLRADPVLTALGELAEGDREVVRLWAFEDLSPTEIAAVLGISPGAARSRLHRARRRLAARLGGSQVGARPTTDEEAH